MALNRAGSLLAASASGERATGRPAWSLLWKSSRPLAAGVIAWMVAGALLPVAVVIFMAEGRAVKIGRHDEILATEGRYAELFELQAGACQQGAEAQTSNRPGRSGDGMGQAAPASAPVTPAPARNSQPEPRSQPEPTPTSPTRLARIKIHPGAAFSVVFAENAARTRECPGSTPRSAPRPVPAVSPAAGPPEARGPSLRRGRLGLGDGPGRGPVCADALTH